MEEAASHGCRPTLARGSDPRRRRHARRRERKTWLRETGGLDAMLAAKVPGYGTTLPALHTNRVGATRGRRGVSPPAHASARERCATG
jgi:hypothetical protein